MEVIHTYQANLATSLNEPVLHAMQYDGARKITVQLYSGHAVWAVPEGVTVGIGYTLPNRQSEYYEKLSDGTAACTVEGNTVTAVLAPILTSVVGEVKVSIIFAKDGVQLSTFPFKVRVAARPGEVDNATRPDVASPFVGKLYYGGDNGLAVPLRLGSGVRVEQQPDGGFMLVADGGGSSGGTTPETVAEMISTHNVQRYAHEDIRIELRVLADRFNVLANSEDIDLDQLSEIVAYIRSNRTLIDAITTAKVSVVDIVDNLATNVANKPLSAAQGVALKEMIDGQGIPDWNQNNPDAPGHIVNRTHYAEVSEGSVVIGLDDTGPLVDALICADLYEHRHEAVFIIGDTEYRIGDSAGSNEASWSYWLVDENGRSGNMIYCYASGENDIDTIDSISIRNNGTGAYIKGTIKYTKQIEYIKRLDSKYLPFLMSLGIHDDGLLYLFIDGKPYGSGIPVVQYC